MAKFIELTKEKRVKVSNEDYDYLVQFKWYASQTNNKYYAARGINKNGKTKVLYMHRVIMKAEGQDIDHRDGNTLNNLRSNLRFAKHHQNLQNQKAQKNRSSGYKGVYLDKKLKTWVVQIKDRGHMRVIGGIENESIAGFIYDLLALDRFKEFAKFNFPEAILAWNTRRKK